MRELETASCVEADEQSLKTNWQKEGRNEREKESLLYIGTILTRQREKDTLVHVPKVKINEHIPRTQKEKKRDIVAIQDRETH